MIRATLLALIAVQLPRLSARGRAFVAEGQGAAISEASTSATTSTLKPTSDSFIASIYPMRTFSYAHLQRARGIDTVRLGLSGEAL
jgi:hypothetical protein